MELPTRICLVGELGDNVPVHEFMSQWNVPVIKYTEATDLDSWRTFFVLKDFEGPIYDHLVKTKQCILGIPALRSIFMANLKLTPNARPLYNNSMGGVVTGFTGIRKKDELTRLVHLIHSMGGCIRKEMTPNVTHLISVQPTGKKYRYAHTFRLPVVRPDWVYAAWEKRDTENFHATSEEFTKLHKLKPFEGRRISFVGFPNEERQHMTEVLETNGGKAVDIDDPNCTHVVISENKSLNKSTEIDEEYCINKLMKTDMIPDSSGTEMDVEVQSLKNVSLGKNASNRFDESLSAQATFASTPNPSPTKESFDDMLAEQIDLSVIQVEVVDSTQSDAKSCSENVKLKRKHECLDDTFAGSTPKKTKMQRSDIITRSIARSMRIGDLDAVEKPMENILESIGDESSSSINRTISAVTRSFCGLYDRVTRSSSKRRTMTANQMELSVSENSFRNATPQPEFKTPKAPIKILSMDRNGGTPKRSRMRFNGCNLDKSRMSEDRKTTSRKSSSTFTTSLSRHLKSSQKSCAVGNWRSAKNGRGSCDDAATVPVTVDDRREAKSKPFRHFADFVGSTLEESDAETLSHSIESSHMVVDEQFVKSEPETKDPSTYVVKSDWFWYTIQNGFADEAEYSLGEYLNFVANTPDIDRHDDALPISLNKRKRKRFSYRQQFDGTPLSSGKRRSSVSDGGGRFSISGSFLDCTSSPEVQDSKVLLDPVGAGLDATQAKKSMRFNHFMDFFSTETNYVNILETIVVLFKNPLEDLAENRDDALLNKSEIKSIFGHFLPIYEVHRHMLQCLCEIQSNWSENCLIGNIVLQHRDQLLKAYPPYVNYFEQMKKMLQNCDASNPRFHAFLKINQAKAECGRQCLQDLMIRPVQRLPSIILLLNDILKYTSKTNPDYNSLEEALKALKEVLTYINEDKRITESRISMFDIFNDIEGCPPDLVSSNRHFVSKCEVAEVSDSLSGHGDALTLFLFNDTMEICKRRSRGINNAKSPGSSKSHKHVSFLNLNSVRYVVDITDSPRAFALLYRPGDKESLYTFALVDEKIDKESYLKALCKQMAENACLADANKVFISRTSAQLDINVNDVNISTLSKAFKFANRTRMKVGRAFSFNKTPNKLKRAVSTMMSPSPFSQTNSLTPATQLSQMRLASCTNIHEASDQSIECHHECTDKETLVPPLSVQPVRKNKNSLNTLVRF